MSYQYAIVTSSITTYGGRRRTTASGSFGTRAEHAHPFREPNMNANAYDQGPALDAPEFERSEEQGQRKAKAPAKRGSAWLMAGLLVLSALPLAFGALRLTQLAGGAEIMPARDRFDASPLPVVLHLASATLYAILGAFQFAPGFRRRRPGWHRAAGRLLVGCGLLVGFSGLWMTLFYPGANGASVLLYAFRLVFGSAMVASIVLGVTTIRRRNVWQHRAWMTRAYAIGLGAGTQMLMLMVGEMLAGPPSELSHALQIGTAWVINLAVAEWAIRRRPRHMRSEHGRTATTGISHG